MDSLSKLFNGINRVKIMRLFLFNPENSYDKSDVIKKSRVSAFVAGKIIKQIEGAKMIRKKIFFKETKQEDKKVPLRGISHRETKKQKNKKATKKKINGWGLNKDFLYLNALQNLLLSNDLLGDKQIIEKIKKTGNIKLIVLSGVFLNRIEESRVDILIVGDKINKTLLQNVIQDIESQVGKELSYATFNTEDFFYRLDICDKLVRDILDYPHRKILKKMDIV
ncbi:hypothetical protein KJ991_01885 [Patescibacteria group bacterium]|nr:hypothetical protein [Patescibacteria group bacterium]MBU4115943.1 hypothetical protein [Patescibacteria group bacterium]